MLGVVVQRCCVRLHKALTTLLIVINSVTNYSKKNTINAVFLVERCGLLILLLLNATLIRRYDFLSK